VRRPTLVDGTRTEALASTTEEDMGRAEEEAEEESKTITDIASTCAFEVVSLRACDAASPFWPDRVSELERKVQNMQELLSSL